jgi:dTDP-glucose 4,6-dehydratase
VKLLVTGGAGFIGSNFIRFWLGRHPSDVVVNLDVLTYAADSRSLEDVARIHGDRYRHIRGDIADRTAVDRAFSSACPDVVINFAAESHNSRAVLDPAVFVKTNVLGTQTLLDACRGSGVKRFHHISTCEVYGDLPLGSSEMFTEDSPYRPRTPYNASKAAADLIVRAYRDTFDCPVTISNCSNNYGPYQHPEKVIPLFITHALRDQPLPVYRSSAHRREWLHVDDHCAAIEAIILRGRLGETYNIGSGLERSIDELADAILHLLGRPLSLKNYVPDRPGHDRRYLLDHTKIRDELGWRPMISFADGLARTVEWYTSHPWWWEPKIGIAPLDEFRWPRSQNSDP